MVERTLMQATRAIADEPPMPPPGPDAAGSAGVCRTRIGRRGPRRRAADRDRRPLDRAGRERADDRLLRTERTRRPPQPTPSPPTTDAMSARCSRSSARAAPRPPTPRPRRSPKPRSSPSIGGVGHVHHGVSRRRRRHRGPPGRRRHRRRERDRGAGGRRAGGDEPVGDDQAALAERDTTLAPIADDLAHRAKRAVQDEQNDVLDGLRRQRGKIDVGKVLPPAEEQLTRWAHVLQPSVDLAYAAGAATMPSDSDSGSGTGAAAAVPGALLTELATTVVTPAAHPPRQLARVDRRQVAGRRRDRDRPAPRRPLPRMAGARPRRGARRRARGGVRPWRVRRRARRSTAALGGGAGRQVPRLRRQRARTDDARRRLPHRTGAPAGTPRLSLPRGPRLTMGRSLRTGIPGRDVRSD